MIRDLEDNYLKGLDIDKIKIEIELRSIYHPCSKCQEVLDDAKITISRTYYVLSGVNGYDSVLFNTSKEGIVKLFKLSKGNKPKVSKDYLL